MQREITVEGVHSSATQGGSIRWVIRDKDGNEYSTFREAIGQGLRQFEGKRARIEFHEQRRGQYTNVYLDAIEPVESAGTQRAEVAAADPEEAAWQTAVAAAPWLVGEPRSAVQPKKALRQAQAVRGVRREGHRGAPAHQAVRRRGRLRSVVGKQLAERAQINIEVSTG
jgi:hypothetical protein